MKNIIIFCISMLTFHAVGQDYSGQIHFTGAITAPLCNVNSNNGIIKAHCLENPHNTEQEYDFRNLASNPVASEAIQLEIKPVSGNHLNAHYLLISYN
ncbi:hypothetical protein [Shewanella algae]|uniref:hypothetical protein n=1 Tax=Shewanella algae TaxID=38313 RepID=UPI0013DE0A40|nr:hypothetical protein [Shewanella algae]